MSRCVLVSVLVAVSFGLGCGDERSEASAGTLCEPGAAQLCSCSDATTGSHICNATGNRWGECLCHDAPTGGNNGPANNGPANNGPGNNGANNGPANNGPANNGPANNGNNGTLTCETDEDCADCGDEVMCVCAPNPQDLGNNHCLPACETDEDCPPGRDDTVLICDTQQGFCVPDR